MGGFVAASFVAFFKHVERMVVTGEFAGFLLALSSFALVACFALIPALIFGVEFQSGTLPLLLSQPIERSRIWKEKLLVGLAALCVIGGFLGLVHELLKLPAGINFTTAVIDALWPGHEIIAERRTELDNGGYWLLGMTFMLATLCSAGLWTLTAGSTIGGAVLSLASQFLPILALVAILERFEVAEPTQMRIIEAAALLYSGIFYWLGYRKFKRFELRQGTASEAGLSGKAHGFFGSIGGEWLRCRPTGAMTNFIRKELWLHKPLFMIAGLLTGGWLITFLLFCLQPGRKEFYDGVFVGLTAVYIALITVLAAVLPLGEERALNLADWQLTLPMSRTIQWGMRLGIALVVMIGLGFLVPLVLSWIISGQTTVGLYYAIREKDTGLLLLLFFAVGLFSMGFWAINVVQNTVRAVVTSLVIVPCIYGLGAASAQLAREFGGAESQLLMVLYSNGLISLHEAGSFDWGRFIFVTSSVVLIAIALIQSLRSFRRPEHTRREMVRSALAFVLAAVVLGLWVGDLIQSIVSIQSMVR